MNNRMLWRALVAALLCAALLCPALALAEPNALIVDDASDTDDILEVDEAFDAALPDLPDLDLAGDLALDDSLAAVEPEALVLDGDTLSNEGESGASEDAPAPEDVVPLVASYTGEPLTKVYDCNKLGAYRPKNADGTYGDIVYIIEALKDITSQFKLAPAEGRAMVADHDSVRLRAALTKQFEAADVGAYSFEFTLTLTGDDAAWYALENPVVKVPATITPREVTVTPRAGLSKVYDTDDPVYSAGTSFTLKYTNGEVAVSQDVGGVETYGVPRFTSDQSTAVKYLIKEAELKGRDFFPGFLSRKPGEKAGKYRITQGTLDFGANFRVKVAKAYFTITRRSIKGSDVTVNAIKDRIYTGKAIRPTPVVKYDGKKLKLGTAYTVKYTRNKNPGKATVTIKGKGNFTGTRKITFRIVMKPTTLSKLTAGKGSITVAWKKGSLNAGYEIAYATDANFINAKIKQVKGRGTTKKTLKNLQSKVTYYVRIRTYKKVSGTTYYSAWSKAKKIRTK